MPTLNNWSVTKEQDPYIAPECRRSILQGVVFEHPAFEDGSRIWTSPITRLEEDFVVTASGTRYMLGTVDPAYEAEFPGARERLFNSLGDTHD